MLVGFCMAGRQAPQNQSTRLRLKVQIGVVDWRTEAYDAVGQKRAEAGAGFDALIPEFDLIMFSPADVIQEIQR